VLIRATAPGTMAVSRRAFLLLVLSSPLLLGWSDTWEGIREGTRHLTAARADFVQEKHLRILARPMVSHGKLHFQAPADLRWEYTAPLRSVLLLQGGRTRRFFQGPDGKLAEERGAALDAMQVVGEEIRLWLAGRFEESKAFAAALAPGPLIVMTPREPGLAALISRIDLKLSPRPGEIETVTIHEGEDAYTRLTFGHTVLNQAMPPAVFEDPH
jgi:hypothetical protein